jgi:hypothetical protein
LSGQSAHGGLFLQVYFPIFKKYYIYKKYVQCPPSTCQPHDV